MNIQINSNNNKIVSGEGEIDYTTSCLFHLLHNTGGVGGGGRRVSEDGENLLVFCTWL